MAGERKLTVKIAEDSSGWKRFADAGERDLGRLARAGGLALAGLAAGAGAALFSIGTDFDGARSSIEVATGATGEKLRGLVDEFSDAAARVPDSMEVVSDSLGTLQTLTGAAGDTLEDLTVAVVDASRMLGEDAAGNADAFGSAMKQWQIPAENGVEVLDGLFKLTQDYGVSLSGLTGNLNKFGPVMQNAGFDINETAEFMAQLEAGGLQVTRIMPGLNKAFRDWAAEGKDSREELDKVIDSIANASTETEALALATETFGAEGAQRMTTAIRNGIIDIDNLGEAMEGTSGLISDTADSSATFSEKWAEAMNVLKQRVAPIAIALIDGITSSIGPLIAGVEDVVSVFSTVGRFIGENAAAFAAFAGIIGTAAVAFGAYTAAMRIAAIAQAAFNVVMTANPIGIVVVALAALVAGLIAAYSHVDAFRNVVDAAGRFFRDEVWPILQTVAANIAAAFRSLADTFTTYVWPVVRVAIQNVMDHISNIWDVVSGVVSTLTALFTGDWAGAWTSAKEAALAALTLIFDWFITFPARLLEALGPIMSTLGTWISDTLLPALAQAALDMAGKLLEWIVWFNTGLPIELAKIIVNIAAWVTTTALPALAGHAVAMAASLITFGANFLTSLPGTLAGMLRSLVTTVLGWIPALLSLGATIAGKIGEFAAEFIKRLPGWAASMLRSVVTTVLGWAAALVALGGTLARKIVDGLAGLGQKIWDAIKAAWSWAKSQVSRLNPINLGKKVVTSIPGAGIVSDIGNKIGGLFPAGGVMPNRGAVIDSAGHRLAGVLPGELILNQAQQRSVAAALSRPVVASGGGEVHNHYSVQAGVIATPQQVRDMLRDMLRDDLRANPMALTV